MLTRTRLLPALLAVAVVAGGLLAFAAYQRSVGARGATTKEQRRAARDLVTTNRHWLKQLAAARRTVARETGTATAAVTRADTARARRQAIPKPAAAAPDTSLVTYWWRRAELAEAEAADLRTAVQALRRAAAIAVPLLDTAAALIDTTTTTLEGSLDREEGKGRGWLAWLPRPTPFVEGGYVVSLEEPGRIQLRGGMALAVGSVRAQAGVTTDRELFVGGRVEF